MNEVSDVVSKDKLLNRISYILRAHGGPGISSASVANRLKASDHHEVKRRIDYLVSKDRVSTHESGRVYNGLPVVLYKWKSEV